MSDPITGLIGSVGGALIGGDSAEDAAAIQSQGALAGVAEQRRQFDFVRELLKPYVEAGPQGLEGQRAFLGLRGPEEEQAAIARLEGGPQFGALMRQGENAILQNASATGGLRGGNVQAALSQFRPGLLSQLIESQYSKLGGLTALGQQSAAGVGTTAMQTGANIANLLGNQSAAISGGALASGAGYAGALRSLSGLDWSKLTATSSPTQYSANNLYDDEYYRGAW